jgi:hypothetical protein
MPKKYEDEKYALPEGISDVVRSYDLMLEKIKDPAQRDATIETMAERMREHHRQTGQKSFPGHVYEDLNAIIGTAYIKQDRIDEAKKLSDELKARQHDRDKDLDREK